MTEVFDLADRIVEDTAAADPITSTFAGVAGYAMLLTDYSADADDGRADQARSWLTELDALHVTDDDDRLAAACLRERLGVRIALHDAGENLRDCNVLGSLVQAPRNVFTLMPTANAQDWDTIATRLEALPECLESVRSAYATGIERGQVAARRQVIGTAEVAALCAGTGPAGGPAPWFATYVEQYDGTDATLQERLRSGADGATRAYADLASWMQDSYVPASDPADAVGSERFVRRARAFTGADLDLTDTYAWGWADLGRITTRLNECAARLYGGTTPASAQTQLDVDPAHTIEGSQAALEWLQHLTDDTIESFDGKYFDIPEAMRRCEAMSAPPGSAAAPFYTPPSEDFARPGRTWLPTYGQDRFRSWWLTSVWYHEAVPGHHLQFGYAMLQRERLSRFQRTEFISGHAEGWALYAERLMDELGYFEDPATELGYLSAQALRAARIVLDIGLHLGLAIPSDVDPALLDGVSGDPRGATWNRELAREFLAARSLQPDAFAASEVDRYLGVPGQAISYKVGERVWLAAREDARSAEGAAFDLKAWHMQALALGSVGLDVLRTELARR